MRTLERMRSPFSVIANRCAHRCGNPPLRSTSPAQGELRVPAAGGGRRELAISAAVENPEDQRKPERFFDRCGKGTSPSSATGGGLVPFPSLDPPSLKRPNGACEPLLDFPGMHPGLYVGAGIPDSPLCFPLRENCRLSLPAAEKESLQFPQRSKIPRISASPMGFSGTARWTGGAKRRMRSPRSGSLPHIRANAPTASPYNSELRTPNFPPPSHIFYKTAPALSLDFFPNLSIIRRVRLIGNVR